jgi:membrane-associated phospholipid phosphatase
MAMAARGARPETLTADRVPAETRLPSGLHRFLQDWAGVGAYVALLTVWIVAKGLPLTRGGIAMWLILGMLALSLRNLRHWVTSVALEWFPFVAFLFLYDVARSFADRLMSINVQAPIDGDRLLFGGHVPTVWLQHHLWHGSQDVRWYDYASWGVYMTYFFGTLAVAAAIWAFAYHRFRRYVAMVSLLSVAGFTTYLLFPAAPPWYAGEQGDITFVPRLTGVVWSHSFVSLSKIVDHGQGLSNSFAAMPSLHAGFTMLITLFLWRSARWWWRIPLAAYPIAMGFTLVYFAEHYAVDVLAGWLYALAAFVAVERFANRRAARRASVAARPQSAGRLVPAAVPEQTP